MSLGLKLDADSKSEIKEICYRGVRGLKVEKTVKKLGYAINFLLLEVLIYKLTAQEQELCIRKGIYPIEYPRVPNIFSSITPSCYIPN